MLSLQRKKDAWMAKLDTYNWKIRKDELEGIRKVDEAKSKKMDELCEQLLQREQRHKEANKNNETQNKSDIDAGNVKLLISEYEVNLNRLHGTQDNKLINLREDNMNKDEDI